MVEFLVIQYTHTHKDHRGKAGDCNGHYGHPLYPSDLCVGNRSLVFIPVIAGVDVNCVIMFGFSIVPSDDI